LVQTRTNGFSKKKQTLVEKEKAISRCQYSGRTFEEVWIFMTLLVLRCMNRFLHVIFG
jgi:hypothetical protein